MLHSIRRASFRRRLFSWRLAVGAGKHCTLLVLPFLILGLAAGCGKKSGADGITGEFVIYQVRGDGGVVNIHARSKEKGKEQRVSFIYDSAEGGWRKCTYWSSKTESFRTRKGGHCKIEKMEVKNSGRIEGSFSMEVTGMEKGKESKISGTLEASGRQSFRFRKQFGF